MSRGRSYRVLPSAKRLMASLRNLAYDMPTAIADLVDNSISAGATEVRITFGFDGEESWIRIADNGKGMTPNEITEALRYGTNREYEEAELGKFGLGLKTASLSQCRRLTVVSRAEGMVRRVIRCWDMDHIEAVDDWSLLVLTGEEAHPEAVAGMSSGSGTVIFWENLDRFLSTYADPNSGHVRNGLNRLCRDTEEHLAAVFHRFLAGEAGRGLPLRIWVQENPLEPWDPFCRSERATVALDPETIEITDPMRGDSEITVTPYVLPAEANFSSTAAHRRASGGKGWNYQQGFYFYRNNRLLQSGGWNRIWKPEEHFKLARIAIDYTTAQDEYFPTDVAKQSVTIPPFLRDLMQATAAPVRRTAKEAYDRGGKREPTPIKPPPLPATGGELPTSATTGLTPQPVRPVAGLDPVTVPTPIPQISQPPAVQPIRSASLWDRLTEVLIQEFDGEPDRLARTLEAIAQRIPELRSTPPGGGE